MVMKKKILQFCFFLTFFAGCYKEHLYVQQEWLDRNYLASSYVNTPDPRQESPPTGHRLLIAWRFPSNLVNYGLNLCLRVRFWDQVEEEIERPICKSHGHFAFNFLDQKILTYRIEVKNQAGEVVEVWEHHFWTKLIDVDRRSSSVSSQPKQGSVMETP